MLNASTRPIVWFDRSAVALSLLCLIHCLLLPFVAVFLPLLGLFAEAEWVHRLFVLTALPISACVFLRPQPDHRARGSLRSLVLLGLLCLVLGAFFDVMHDYETVLTVIGALCVATAHGLHSRRFHARPNKG